MGEPGKDKEKTSSKPAAAPTEAPAGGKNLPPGVKTSLESGNKALGKMREQLGWPQQKEAQPPVTGTAGPVQPQTSSAPVEGKSGETDTTKKVEEKKETPAEFRSRLQKEADSSSLFELLGKAMQSLAGLLEGLKNWEPMKSLGFGGDEKKEEQRKSTGEKYTEEQLKQLVLDLTKNKDKVYPSQDKAVEDVATVLNLPLRETPQKFLDSLTDSGMVFDQSMDKMNDLEPGDVLFFKKSDDKGQDYAYTCAVVTVKEPLTMRIVPDGGGVPKEMVVKESDYFKNRWYGFVKTRQNVDT